MKLKGQMGLEYYVSLVLFVMFVAYLVFQVLGISPQYMSELTNERIKSEAYQVSELLINDAGEPLNWYTSTPKRIGLSSNENRTNLLSQEKITALNAACQSDYESVKRLIDIDSDFSITLTNLVSGNKLIDCQPPSSIIKKSKASITRIASLPDNSFAEITIQMW